MDVLKKDNVTAYSADVTLAVMKNNKILKKKTFKNSGRWPMFYFISCCLAGDFTSAVTYLPKYIDVFHAGNFGDPIPFIGEEHEIGEYANGSSRRTLVTYTYTTAPIPDHEETSIGSANVTYKFMIPFTHINTRDSINLICLYDDASIRQTPSDFSNPSAFFFIKDDSNPTKLGALLSDDDISYGETNDYNVFIEWKINIENKGE